MKKDEAKPMSFILEQKNEEKESTAEQKLNEFVWSQLDNFFVENIPIEYLKNLAGCYLYSFGIFAYCVLLVVFFYFFYTNYVNSINQAFISLDDDSGTCETVPVPITGSFLADRNGYWYGNPHFVYSSAKFEVKLASYTVSGLDQYQEMIRVFEDDVHRLANTAGTRTGAHNLILWMSFIRFYSTTTSVQSEVHALGDGNVQYFQLTGHPSIVFNKEFVFADLSGAAGHCNILGDAFFDEANSLLIQDYQFEEFNADPVCSSALNPVNVGFNEASGSIFRVSLDIRAFSTAMALNLDYIHIQDLRHLEEQPFSFVYNDVTYNVTRYFDIRYPTMEPIYCSYNVSEIPPSSLPETFCTIVLVESVFLPVFNHLGASTYLPEYCNCSTDVGNSELCHEFRMMVGLIFYPLPAFDPTTDTIENMISRQLITLLKVIEKNGGYEKVNRNSYNASFIQSATFYKNLSETLSGENAATAAHDFCFIDGTSCTVLNFFETEIRSHTISDFQLQLPEPSCDDTFSIPDSAWELLKENPPSSLEQGYYECYPTEFETILNAIGVASGNTSIAMIGLFLILMPILYYLMVILDEVPPKPEYSDRELHEALRVISLVVLRAKDGNTIGLPANSVVKKFVNEIVNAADYEAQSNKVQKIDLKIDTINDCESIPDELMKENSLNGRQKGLRIERLTPTRPPLSSSRKSLRFFATGRKILTKNKDFDSQHFESHLIYPYAQDLPENSDIQILNNLPVGTPVPDPLSVDEIYDLLEVLFSKLRAISFEKELQNSLQPENSSVELETTQPTETKEDVPIDFKELIYSHQFLNFNITDLTDFHDPSIFVKLSNILSMHASLVLRKPLIEITTNYRDKIAYNVGGRILTYSSLLYLINTL